MSPRSALLCTAAALLALTIGACAGRPYLTADFGKASHAIFARQVIHPDAGNKPLASLGLDSQEAALVAESYRRSLTPKGAQVQEEQPLILMAPPTKAPEGKLAPSVPPEK